MNDWLLTEFFFLCLARIGAENAKNFTKSRLRLMNFIFTEKLFAEVSARDWILIKSA